MKTYSAFYVSDGSRKIFERKTGSELYGLLPAGVRLVQSKVKDLEEAGRKYQCFGTREGPQIVVVEDEGVLS